MPDLLFIPVRCGCGHLLKVTPEDAGGAVQCTVCGRLLGVPELDDLTNLDEEGQFRLATAGWQDRAADRNAPSRASAVNGPRVIPLRVETRPHLRRLKRCGPQVVPYHPSKQGGAGLRPRLHTPPVWWGAIPLELLQPANVLVLGIVLAFHVILQGLTLAALAGVLPFWLFVAGGIGLWLAHLGNVLDETGPEGHDELPTVLRNLAFDDDIFLPVGRLLLALLLCFLPAGALWRSVSYSPAIDFPTVALASIASAAGLMLFPVMWLTVATSGTVLNLLPHRVLGTLLVSPGKLALAVLALVGGVATYGLGVLLTLEVAYRVANKATFFPWQVPIWLASIGGYAILSFGVYLLHGLAWLLGKIYQQHHEQFPWLLQRHVRTPASSSSASSAEQAVL